MSSDPEGKTIVMPADAPAVRRRRAEEQFAPGTIVAERYRISSILGAGGMGEVYRGDDIKLDQAVALKFLPARLARDPILLGRLHECRAISTPSAAWPTIRRSGPPPRTR
jgi:serine/threonine protein kinase